jgi:hypothetical protein
MALSPAWQGRLQAERMAKKPPDRRGWRHRKAGHHVKVWKRILVNTPILTGAPLT